MNRALGLCAAAALAAVLVPPAVAQSKPPAVERDATTAEFEKFREVLEADNPAELFEVKGEELWKTPRGPTRRWRLATLGSAPGWSRALTSSCRATSPTSAG